ncbi:MAG: MIP/aquaporin family protein [Miltoncostaeaceae bacterium]
MVRRASAEFLGTYALVAIGTGAVVVAQEHEASLGPAGVAAAFGLVVAAVIFAIGHLSGAHINPAVTVAFALGRHFAWREVPVYVAVQLAGAIAASASLLAIFGSGPDLGVTVPTDVSSIAAVAIEMGLTAFLVCVILAVATDTRAAGAMAAVAVGATVGLEALVFGPVTGASMNPARSLGPAVVSGEMGELWVYLVGPLAGAALGVAIYEFLRGAPPGEAQGAASDVEAFSRGGDGSGLAP